MTTPHFEDKPPLQHVAQARAKGFIASSEIHGTETPGSISAATDAARETALFLLFFFVLTQPFTLSFPHLFGLLLTAAFGWLVWKAGRSAWLGWSRLERLHRILEEERWEIEHNRSQEREELRVLYADKGFEGQLLEDVVDVLMADSDRLLKVMVEEELGLSLEVQDHPLQQGLGAACGAALAAALCLLGLWLWPLGGLYMSACLVLGLSGYVAARFEGNRLISAIVWNVSIAILAVGSAHFLLSFIWQVRGW